MASRLLKFLWRGFEAGVRGDAFDRLLDRHPRAGITTDELVAAYRAHTPAIELDPADVAVLDELARSYRLGVLTDGPVSSQRAKVAALGLDRWFAPIVLTGELGEGYAKPHPRGYAVFPAAWDCKPSELAYVADNPHKDFATPRAAGWATVRLRRTGQLHYAVQAASADERAEHCITSLREMPQLLTRLAR